MSGGGPKEEVVVERYIELTVEVICHGVSRGEDVKAGLQWCVYLINTL